MFRRMKFAYVAVLFTVLAASCGDDKSQTGEAVSSTAATGAATTSLQPRAGGTLVSVGISEPAGLDPIVSTGGGTTGGIEMTAIYDTIMRFNPETLKYETRTAESLAANADSSEWTLKLKPNI